MDKQNKTKLKRLSILVLFIPLLNGCTNYENPDAKAEMYSTLTVEEQQEIRERWSE